MRRALLVAVHVIAVVVACGGGGGGGGKPPVVKPGSGAPVTTPAKPAVDPQTWDQLKGPIKSVVVNAEAALKGPLAEQFARLVGKPLDREALRGELAKALAMRGVADIVASGIQQTAGIELVVDVTGQPMLRKLSAVEASGTPVSLGIAGTGIGTALDPRGIEEIADKLRERYLDNGFVDVQVTWKRIKRTDGVEVLIEVAAGQASTIGVLQFSGNKAISAARLEKEIATTLVVGQPVKADHLERASLLLSALYWETGYANVKVKTPDVTGGGKHSIVFAIEEGGQFKIGKVTITGDPPAKDHPRYLKIFGVKTGDLFKRSAIAGGRDKVSEAVVAGGFKNANVLPLTKVDLKKLTIDLTLEIKNQ